MMDRIDRETLTEHSYIKSGNFQNRTARFKKENKEAVILCVDWRNGDLIHDERLGGGGGGSGDVRCGSMLHEVQAVVSSSVG